MSRAIRLTRLHAINWYGYRDSFDVTGNLLIAGVTGSGKSVLMDLVQFVLVANQQKVRYNLSATGDRSTRDLKGYCLGDTKQDVDGVAQYMRNGGITYVAMEFTWPSSRKPRIETWGLRIEFESASQATPSVRPFFAPASLRRDDFLDAEKYPLDLAAFRAHMEGTKDADGNCGRLFTGVKEYSNEMALPSHLNFDRLTLDYLLPAAMSFTFMDSFSDFCRRYVLPSETVDIQSVKDSYLVFRNLQTELAQLRDQQDRLEKIHAFDQQRQGAERDRVVNRYLEAECRRDDALEQRDETSTKFTALEQELAGETNRLAELATQIETTKELIRGIEATFNATEDGKLYRRILQENKGLVGEIERLKEIGQSVGQARQLRVKNTNRWLDQLDKLPFELKEPTVKQVRQAVTSMTEAKPNELRERTRELATKSKLALETAKSAAASTVSRHSELDREINSLKATHDALRSGVLMENSTLLNALNSRLPRRGSAPAAQALWQLCEVTDETWRPALEVAFGRKFSVVVEELDYDRAEQIYHELKENARGESLVNPGQALSFDRQPLPNSLANKLEVPSGNRVARALVNHLFGDVICVKTPHELREHPKAITPDGFMAQRPFVQRPRHYDHRPCIGQRGLEKQRAYLQTEWESRQAEQVQLKPALDAWRAAQNFFQEARLDSESLHDDLAEAARLPGEEAKLKRNLDDLGRIRSDTLEAREQELEQAQSNQKKLQDEWDNLNRSPKQHELKSLRLRLGELETELSNQEKKFEEIRDGADISLYLTRVGELRAKVLAEFPVKSVAAGNFNEKFHDARVAAETARTNLVGERRAIASHPDYGGKYSDLDVEAASNERFDARLEKIRGAQIRDFEEKAGNEERNWQELFRSQVLEKLRERLMVVEDLMALLKIALDKPIGNNRYTIKATPNRDGEFDLYRKLLDLSAAARDGGLFASADTEVREAVERMFKSLTSEPPGKDADAFLDYRNYFDYDIQVANDRDPDARPYSVNRQAGKSSGGENQTPYFIAILASYLRAYRRHETRRKEPSLALVPIDEAFSKLSGERIRDCITALKQLDLQGLFSMSTGNIPYAIDHCDQVIAVHKQEKTVGRKTSIRNVAALLTRVEAIERFSGAKR